LEIWVSGKQNIVLITDRCCNLCLFTYISTCLINCSPQWQLLINAVSMPLPMSIFFHSVSWSNITYTVSRENYTLSYLCKCIYFLVRTHLSLKCRGRWQLKVSCSVLNIQLWEVKQLHFWKAAEYKGPLLTLKHHFRSYSEYLRSNNGTVWQVKLDHSDSDK
jgi:hypothetical protein